MKNISLKKEEVTAGRLQPDRWVENYASQLFGYAFARVADEQYAEDIVQSTFFSAWKGREGYNGEASEKNWLFAICKNKIIDHYRSISKNRNINGAWKGEEDIYFDHTGHWTEEAAPKEWGALVEHPGEDREFYEVLAKCTNKLKHIQQQVFSLKYLDEMDADQICEALRITPSNYWVLIHRAKLHLRACLEKNWLHLK